MSRSPLVAFVLLTAALSAQPALQPAWSERSPWPAARLSPSIAYDAARERLLLFGGMGFGIFQQFRDTWEWNGACWLQASSPIRPSTRRSAGMAYDQTRRRMVLFGCGDAWNTGNNETWEFDGSVWAQRFPAHAPPPRMNEALTYDVLRQRVVLFGGIVEPSKTCLADTWEWDGSDWVQRLPAMSPAARSQHAITYDAARGRVLMFGGRACNRGPLFGDTWEWDGNNWSEQAPTVAPAPRAAHGLAYDAAHGRVVLFGGKGSTLYDDTWTWDGTTWTQQNPLHRPPSRFGHAMTYDEVHGEILLVGGEDASGVLTDAWGWNGASWQEAGTPFARSGHAITFDAARRQVVLFGSDDGPGLADSMWGYRDTGAFEHYGSACNPNGTPPAMSTFGDAGLSAACFGFDVADAPPGAPVLLLLSINRSAIPIGACRLLVDPSLIVTVGDTANDYGSAMMPIPVPGDRRLVGGAVFAQVIALDTAANQLVFTDGVRFRVGD